MKIKSFCRVRTGFTIVEIVITATIVSIVLGLSFGAYRWFIERAKKTEAVVTVAEITKAEEFNKQEKGKYVAAANTQEINRALNMMILPKYYEYQVVGVTDQNFIVVARRIGSKIEDYLMTGRLPPDEIVVARDKNGAVRRDYPDVIKRDSGSGTSSGSSGSGGGFSGGGGSSDSGTGSGGGSVPATTPIPGPGGTSTVTSPVGVIPPFYSSDVEAILNILKDSTAGKNSYNLIIGNQIKVKFEDFSPYPTMSNALGFWAGKDDNTIRLNQALQGTSPNQAFASIIAHEAMHADYSYEPQKWIDATLHNHPELTASDLHITSYPYNSIDQEYNAFQNGILVWQEIKHKLADAQLDAWEAAYVQGEDYMKAQIRLSYAEQMLPEY